MAWNNQHIGRILFLRKRVAGASIGLVISTPIFLLLAVAGIGSTQQNTAAGTCAVTKPNGVVAGTAEQREGSYGNAVLSVEGLRPDSVIVFRGGGPGFVSENGALRMKFGWTRAVPGALTVTGRRLDGVAAPLRLESAPKWPEVGFQASHLVFSAPGCWRVDAQLGDRTDSKLTFVTRVEVRLSAP